MPSPSIPKDSPQRGGRQEGTADGVKKGNSDSRRHDSNASRTKNQAGKAFENHKQEGKVSRTSEQAVKAPKDKNHAKEDYRNSVAGGSSMIQFVTTFISDFSFGNGTGAPIQEQTFDDAILGYAQSIQVGLNVLTDLAGMYPVIGPPVLAFKLVVTLDLKRRENNAKVLAVKVQMQNMMSVLFQIRNVKDPNHVARDGRTLPGRLQNLMLEIADFIKEAGSGCDMYLNKSLIRKCLKAYKYEARLADYASRFIEYKDQLSEAIAIHTTIGVDTANEKLDTQDAHIKDLKRQVQQMQQFLVRLDTRREQEIRHIIDSHGGPKASVLDNDVLQQLIQKSGEDVSNFASRIEVNLQEMQQSLLDELSEDIEKALQQNLQVFAGKLDMQHREMSEALKRLDEKLSGGEEHIKDLQLQNLWGQNGWKSTVKAQRFILALRDHFLDLLPPTNARLPSQKQRYALGKEDWAKTYINLSSLQAISEAIDDDGSGFINIKEVNDFTTACPEGWTLTQWLAYWAAGWHSSISNYSTEIYRLLRKFHRLRNKVRPDNRWLLDVHLDGRVFYRLELLLRSTRTVPEGTLITPELANLRDQFCASEEKRLEGNLERISGTIDSVATVSLVTGPGRIERYIFPLIYLLLKRQLRTIQLARSHTLHMDELGVGYASLGHVFSAFDKRLQDRIAIFKQMHINVEEQLENIAFGMFKDSVGPIRRVVSGYKLSSAWQDLPRKPGEDDDVERCPKDIPLTILKYGVQEPLSFPRAPPPTPVTKRDSRHVIRGTWSGYCLEWDDVARMGLLSIKFDGVMEKRISGTAESYRGSGEVTGLLASQGKAGYDVDFVMTFTSENRWMRCKGLLNTASEKITGRWCYGSSMSEPRAKLGSAVGDHYHGKFEFSRTPAALMRFRYSQGDFTKGPARARWSFARAAILYNVQQKRFSRDYVVSRLRDLRRVKELATKHLIEGRGASSRSELTRDERRELVKLTTTICPTVFQFYFSIARFIYDRLLPVTRGASCNGPECGKTIIQTRFLCIVCIDSTLVGSLNFCINCQDKDLPNHATHTGSHSLIRADRFVQDCERVWMIPRARKLSNRLKAAFRARTQEKTSARRDSKDLDGNGRPSAPSTKPMVCHACRREVSPPCWIYLQTDSDIFACDACEKLPITPEKVFPTRAPENHVMLRITDDKHVDVPDDAQLVRVEDRLVAVKQSVEQRLDSLDKRVTNSIASLEQRMGDMRGQFNQRFDSLEARFTSLEQMLNRLVRNASASKT